MLKFIPLFSCWKIGPDHVLVVASCAKTHEIRVYQVTTGGVIDILNPTDPFPDLRMFIPCRWHALSAVQRANVRDRFHQTLTRIYGDELLQTSAHKGVWE